MQQFSYLPNLEPSAASQLFRGISEPARNIVGDNTDIAQLAQGKADKNGTTSITEALNDFTSIFNDFHGHDSSNITINDINGSLFNNGNIFKTKEGREVISEMGSIFQNDIYLHNIAQDGGLRYAQSPKQVKSGALDFAKADINAIEKSHYAVSGNKGKGNGSLDAKEATSANHGMNEMKYSRLLAEVDLDSKYGCSPEEYASYMIAADAIRLNEETGECEFDFNKVNGIVSQEEAQLASKIDNKTFKDFAIQAYNKFYAGLFGKIQ